MKPKYFKNILIITIGMLIIYGLFREVITNHLTSEVYVHAIDLKLRKKILLVVCGTIYAIMIFRVLFFGIIVSKILIRKSKKVNMTIPIKKRYNEIIKGNCSKILIRNRLFYSGNTYNTHYISNEQGELMYIVSCFKRDFPTFHVGYSIFDPFNNHIGEIKRVKPFNLLKHNYNVILKDKLNFNIIFDVINITSRKVNSSMKVIEIIDLPLKFDNDFLDAKHLINLDCCVSTTKTEEVVAVTKNIGIIGNSDMTIVDNTYQLGTIFLYVCMILEKFETDGLNTTIIMPEDIMNKINKK